MHACTYRR
uniref:Uncharacterized protein n=1 Tax=Arundo donax TaxID=35708 RepID=A0A0A9GSF2_ARUDO